MASTHTIPTDQPIIICPYCGGKTKNVTAQCNRCQYPHSGSDREKKQFLKSRLIQLKRIEKLTVLIWIGRIPLFFMILMVIMGTVPGESIGGFLSESYPLLAMFLVIPGMMSINNPVKVFQLCFLLIPGFAWFLSLCCQITPTGIGIIVLFMLFLLIGYLYAKQREPLMQNFIFPGNYDRVVMLTGQYPDDEDAWKMS